MGAARSMADLIDAAALASDKIRTAREVAATMSLKTIREVEVLLQSTLKGDTFRGMPDLIPFNGQRKTLAYNAARVMMGSPGASKLLPYDGREVLVLNKHGKLMMARMLMNHETALNGATWAERAANDDELQSQDLEPFARTVQWVLERHIARTEKTVANYEAAALLSARIADAIGFRF